VNELVNGQHTTVDEDEDDATKAREVGETRAPQQLIWN
jgi:hypothetical protein